RVARGPVCAIPPEVATVCQTSNLTLQTANEQPPMSAQKFKTWAARGDWAVFQYDDGNGNRTLHKVPIRFWRELEDAEMVALVTDKGGLCDAKKCSNFVRFECKSTILS